MAYLIRVPKLGLEMETGEIVSWEVAEGDEVSEGDVVAQIESEKTVGDVEAREDGVLRKIILKEGDSAPPATPMAIIADPTEDISELLAGVDIHGADKISSGNAETVADDERPTRRSHVESEVTVKASPRARKRAADLDIDLATVEGTGLQGSITASDVDEAALERTGDAPKLTPVEESPLRGRRRTIADRLGRSYRNAVHVTVHRTADAEGLYRTVDLVEQDASDAVSVTDVVLVALSATLGEHSVFNATLEDGTLTTYEEHNVGIAVDVDDGLLTPILSDIRSKSVTEVARVRRRVTDTVRAGNHSAADLKGGTFTVSNLGTLGVESFTPIIDPPQVAILGLGAIGERPVPGSDGTVEFRRSLPLDLSFDHRAVDGADAARFLETLVEYLEKPSSPNVES